MADDRVKRVNIELPEWLPLTENGKVDRSGEGDGSHDRYQQVVAKVFEEVLDRKNLGLNDDFFLLGGDSLIAAKIVSRLKKLTTSNISMRDIFDAPSISELAKLVEARLNDDSRGPPIEV